MCIRDNFRLYYCWGARDSGELDPTATSNTLKVTNLEPPLTSHDSKPVFAIERVPTIEELADHGSLTDGHAKVGDAEAHSEVANLVQVQEGDDSTIDRYQRSDPGKKHVHRYTQYRITGRPLVSSTDLYAKDEVCVENSE